MRVCVCHCAVNTQALGLRDVSLHALQEQYKRQAAAQRRTAPQALDTPASADMLLNVALNRNDQGKVCGVC